MPPCFVSNFVCVQVLLQFHDLPCFICSQPATGTFLGCLFHLLLPVSMFSVDGTQDVYGELCELLVAGGYFRARITSLSPFDKIAGGLAWGIQSSREAIDVEFIEDANIGHKIKIGENIEAALCNMSCPFPLAAHQVQGLDFPQIFPVVQWLLKKVISTREENARALREHADLCFKRSMGDVLTEDSAPRTELVPKRVQSGGAVPERRGPCVECSAGVRAEVEIVG